jgi:hypothetical protein
MALNLTQAQENELKPLDYIVMKKGLDRQWCSQFELAAAEKKWKFV